MVIVAGWAYLIFYSHKPYRYTCYTVYATYYYACYAVYGLFYAYRIGGGQPPLKRLYPPLRKQRLKKLLFYIAVSQLSRHLP